jgi:hypothetical protein
MSHRNRCLILLLVPCQVTLVRLIYTAFHTPRQKADVITHPVITTPRSICLCLCDFDEVFIFTGLGYTSESHLGTPAYVTEVQ